jgi:hypothetical protein
VRWQNSSAGEHRSRDSLLVIGKHISCRNYNHVARLWELEQWLPHDAVDQARSHYAGYSVQRTDGLRIISLNTDFCKQPLRFEG